MVRAAVWVECPGVRNEGLANHFMRDNCLSCAPWWERYPQCPHCKKKAQNRAYGTRQKCRGCQQYFLLEADTYNEK